MRNVEETTGVNFTFDSTHDSYTAPTDDVEHFIFAVVNVQCDSVTGSEALRAQTEPLGTSV